MSRLVRFLGRTKAYIEECKHSMAPMPNPEWYDEKKDTVVTFKNLRKLPLSVHAQVWSSTWTWYKGSFEESFAWGKRRKDEASKQQTEKHLSALQGMVKDAREATHNTPEDIAASKQAIKELLQEIHDNRDNLKSAAQEKLDVIRVSLFEFSSGYREARDQEVKRVMAMDKSVLQNFLNERVGEAKHASSILSDALVVDANGKVESPAAQASSESTPLTTGETGNKKTKGVVDGGADESTTPRDFLSKRARGAVDDVLSDPDIERLLERAGGFAKGRFLQAEAAARVFKGEEAGGARDREGVQRSEGNGTGVQTKEAVEAGTRESGSRSAADSGDSAARETPILSGIASDAREFVAGRLGQARDGARQVVDAVIEVRKTHQSAEDDSQTRGNVDQQEARKGDGDQGGSEGSAIKPRSGSAKSRGREPNKDRTDGG